MAKKETRKKEEQSEIETLKIGWQRCQADFENYKKRTSAEKSIWQEEAKIDFLNEILPILDNLSLMDRSVPKDLENNSWVRGVLIISNQIDQALNEMNIEKIDPEIGDVFDHNLHEAISVETSDSIQDGHIVRIQKQGYRTGERVIRPATVITSSGPAAN